MIKMKNISFLNQETADGSNLILPWDPIIPKYFKRISKGGSLN